MTETNAGLFFSQQSSIQKSTTMGDTTNPFQSSMGLVKKDDLLSTFGRDFTVSNGIINQSAIERTAQITPSPTTNTPTKSLKERQADMKRQFEESLHKEDVENLPAIQVLKVIKTTERVPVISSSIKVIKSDNTNQTSSFPPPLGTPSAVQLPHENESIQITVNSRVSPNIPSSNNNDEMEIINTSDDLFLKKPSQWNKNDRRFQGVRTRRFIGPKEVPHSLFDDGMSYFVFFE